MCHAPYLWHYCWGFSNELSYFQYYCKDMRCYVMWMSSCPDGAGWGGRDGWKGEAHCGRHGDNMNNKKQRKNDMYHPLQQPNMMFSCVQSHSMWHSSKLKKNITAYIHHKGENEAVLIAKGVEMITTPTITMPPVPPLIEDPNSMGQQLPMMVEKKAAMFMWEGQIKFFPRRQLALPIVMVQASALIWDQWSLTMMSKLKELSNYNALKTNKKPVEQLAKMRSIICEH